MILRSCRVLLGILLALAGSSAIAAPATVRHSASVAVSIKVLPFVETSLPLGSHFFLHVPQDVCVLPGLLPLPLGLPGPHGCSSWAQHFYPPVLPVRIPFTVTGNTTATATTTPDSFLRISTGRYLGQATRPSSPSLGYHAVMHFPAPAASYKWLLGWSLLVNWDMWRNWAGYGVLPSWSHVSWLPGLLGAGTPPLSADLVQMHGRAFGVVYVVAESDWTATGVHAPPGDYYGTVTITVTTNQ